MAPKPLRIVAIGKIRTPFWKDAAEHYLARLRHWRDVQECLLRDGDASLPVPNRNAVEGRRILDALAPQDVVVVMDERGKRLTSPQFADFLRNISENAAARPCFVIGGPFGLVPEVRAAARHVISLGPMTLPHELARVLLCEQLYRAECIIRRVPYHH